MQSKHAGIQLVAMNSQEQTAWLHFDLSILSPENAAVVRFHCGVNLRIEFLQFVSVRVRKKYPTSVSRA